MRAIFFIVIATFVFSVRLLTMQRHQSRKFIEILNVILKNVQNAYMKSSYGIACALVDNRNGSMIFSLQNRVVKTLKSKEAVYGNGILHAQTQTIKWFWENRQRYNLSQPSDYTIITSLDPCLMCTGNILLSGFNVGVVQSDPSAGIGWRKTGKFDQWLNISKQIYQTLTEKFGYYRIAGLSDRREYKGSQNVVFKQEVVPYKIYRKMQKYQIKGHNNVVNLKKKNYFADINSLKDISLLNKDSRTVKKLKQVFPDALSMKVSFNGLGKGDVPQQLKQLLIKKVRYARNATNAIAMIDRYDNLLAVQADSFELGPVFTSIFNLQYKYFQMYFELINEASLNPGGYMKSTPYFYLPYLKHCKFVMLNALDLSKVQTLQLVGIFRHSINKNQQEPAVIYINKAFSSKEGLLGEFTQALPPSYKDVYNQKKFILSNKNPNLTSNQIFY